LLIISVIVQSNCHISQFSHQLFNVSVLLLDDTLKPATPLTNDAINQTLRQFALLSSSFGWLSSLAIVDVDKLSVEGPQTA